VGGGGTENMTKGVRKPTGGRERESGKQVAGSGRNNIFLSFCNYY